MKKYLLPLLMVTLMSPSAFAAPGKTFDSSFLGKISPQQPSESDKQKAQLGKPKRQRHIEDSKDTGGVLKTTDYSEKLTYETIESLTQLLRTTPVSPARNTLLLNRAAAMNLYARKRLIASKAAKMDPNGIKFLEAAVHDSSEVLNSRQRGKEEETRAHNLLGFSYLYLDRNKEARAHFNDVLRLNPNVENAGWIGLFIAEELFDDGKFQDAANYYTTYYPKMSPQSQELALYKLAWCMINLNKQEKAEEIFLKVARSPSRYGLAKDAIRDLAYLITHRSDPAQAIRNVENLFQAPPDKLDFLSAVRLNLETQGEVSLHSEVVRRMLQLETNVDKRLELLLADMRVNRRLYASRAHLLTFRKVDAQVRESKLTANSTEIKKYETLIETELLALIKAFIETYSNRTKTPEKIERGEMAEALKQQFWFFTTYVVNSKVRPLVMNLWLDVCVSNSDWECVDGASESILTDRTGKLAQFKEKATLDQLAALEAMIQRGGKDDNRKAELKVRRVTRMRQIINDYPNSDQWLRVARAYAQLEIDEGRHKETIPLLDKIYSKDGSQDAFYRLQFARFKSGDLQGILDDPRNSSIKNPDPRIMDLWRECSLQMAQEARKKEDVAAYRKNLKRFLDLKPDRKKTLVAKEDLLRFALEKNATDEATAEFLALDEDARTSKPFADIRKRLWLQAMEKGHYREAAAMASSGKEPRETATEMAYARMLSQLALGKVPGPSDLTNLSSSNRDYMMGLLALVRPDVILTHFKGQKNWSKADKEMILLALRLQTGDWLLRKTPEVIRFVGADYPFLGEDSEPQLNVEKRILRVGFPSSKASAKTVGKMLGGIIQEVHAIRQRVPKEIQGHTPVVQHRAVEAARKLEQRVGELILGSAIPKELAPEQVEDYKKGLASAAKEFLDQAYEFEATSKAIQEKISAARSHVADRLFPKPDPAKWPWPSAMSSNPALKGITDAVRSNNILAALALTDLMRQQHLKDDKDFFLTRTGILLASRHKDSLRVYLYGELEANGRTDVISDWGGLVGRTIGSSNPTPAPSVEPGAKK